jgi:hypothetical protein
MCVEVINQYSCSRRHLLSSLLIPCAAWNEEVQSCEAGVIWKKINTSEDLCVDCWQNHELSPFNWFTVPIHTKNNQEQSDKEAYQNFETVIAAPFFSRIKDHSFFYCNKHTKYQVQSQAIIRQANTQTSSSITSNCTSDNERILKSITTSNHKDHVYARP